MIIIDKLQIIKNHFEFVEDKHIMFKIKIHIFYSLHSNYKYLKTNKHNL